MSVEQNRRASRLVAGFLGTTALALCWTQAWAEDALPAVSKPNGKIAIGGGQALGEGVYYVDASVSLPVMDQIGLQIDGLAGTLDGDGVAGGGAHLFWRDPSVGLVGAYGSVLASTAGVNYTVSNAGLEAAAYLGQFSVEGLVGAQFVDGADTEVFGAANIAFYPIDDVRLYAGYRYWFGENAGAAGVEFQPFQMDDSLGITLFADGQIREDDTLAVAGFRVYFGEHKSLIRRHREDDPSGLMPNDLFAIEQLFNNVANAAPPPGDGLGICNSEDPPKECFKMKGGDTGTFCDSFDIIDDRCFIQVEPAG